MREMHFPDRKKLLMLCISKKQIIRPSSIVIRHAKHDGSGFYPSFSTSCMDSGVSVAVDAKAPPLPPGSENATEPAPKTSAKSDSRPREHDALRRPCTIPTSATGAVRIAAMIPPILLAAQLSRKQCPPKRCPVRGWSKPDAKPGGHFDRDG